MANVAFDHLLYAGPDLDELKSDLNRRSGLQAVTGGRHADWGSHNALVGLGEGNYLELVAPEPGATGPWGDLFGTLPGPSLQAWCVRAGPAAEVEERLATVGVGTRRVAGGRRLADGSMLTWQLVFPVDHGFGGALPFFIDWGEAVHPSLSLVASATLTGLTVTHPASDEYARVLGAVGKPPPGLTVENGTQIALSARFDTAADSFELQGHLNPDTYLGKD